MKSKTAAYLLLLFLGWAGAHKFYLGKLGMGVGYLFTGAFLGVGWLIDAFTLGGQVDAFNAAANGEPDSETVSDAGDASAKKKSVPTVAIVVGVISAAFFLLLVIGAIIGDAPPAGESQNGGAIADTSEWYEGGTLHQATMAEWRDATYENKLATAADFLAATVWEGSLNTPSDFPAMHEDAVAVVVELDESIRGTDVADNTKVSEMAAMLFILIPDLGPDR